MNPVYRLLQFTDVHLFADPAGQLRGVRTLETLQMALAEARRQHWPPDLVLVTGDIAQDESRGAYRLFRDCFADLDAPVLCLPGNHDNPAYMREILAESPFQFCGTADLGGWLLTMMNTHNPGDAGGYIDAEQLEQLSKTLAANGRKHVLIGLHHHPVSCGSRGLDTVALRNAAELWDVVEQHEQVRCLLWGHVHQAHEYRRDGRLLLATPSTCRQFLPDSDRFALDEERPPAYRWLNLHPDGTVVTAVNWCGKENLA